MLDRPRRVKIEVLPGDDYDVDAGLQALHDAGMIERYEVDGNKYIQVVNFAKHQNPHINEKKSTIPAPRKHSTSTMQAQCEHGTSTGVIGLIPDSRFLIPDSQSQNTEEEERVRARIDPDPQSTPETAPNAFADSLDLPRPDSLEAYISNYVASVMTTAHWQQLDDILASGTPDNLVRLAIDEACAQGKATWAYVYSILNRWTTAGVKTVAQARQQQAQFKASRTQPHSRDRPPDRPGGGGQPKFFDGGADA